MVITVIATLAFAVLTVSPAWAAQGQITEVNPSGIGIAKQKTHVAIVLLNTPAAPTIGIRFLQQTSQGGVQSPPPD